MFDRHLSHGPGAFLGVTDSEQNDSAARWLQRRAAFHGSSVIMGRGVSKKCKDQLDMQEEVAPFPTPYDPLHKPGMLILITCSSAS